MIKKKSSTQLESSLNFELFYRIASQRKLGVIATSVLVAINFAQINIFLFQSFEIFTPNNDIIVDIVNGITKYIYMAKVVRLGSLIYQAFRIIFYFMTLGYFLIYILLRFLISRKMSIPSLEKFFMFVNSYYTMIILLPTTDILFRDIFCDDLILAPLGLQCLEGDHIFIFIISCISLICALTMTILTLFYSLNGIYDKKNYLSGENRLYESMVAFIRIILTAIVANANDSVGYLRVYLAINIICSLAMLAYFMFYYPYNKSFVERFTLMWLTIYLMQSLSMVVAILVEDELISVGYLFCASSIIGVPAINIAYNKIKGKLIIKTKLKSTREKLIQIQNILQLKQNETIFSHSELMFRGLISRHFTQCTELHCFCKTLKLYDPKKKRDIETQEWAHYKPVILKYYVKMIFEKEIKNGDDSPDMMISYAEFLFQKFRNTHLALFQITKILNSSNFLYPHQRFRILKLKYKISEYINARNNEALEKQIETENVIFVETQFEKVLEGMKRIIQTSLEFWRYLSNKDIDLEKLRVFAASMHNSVISTESFWKPLKKYLYKQKKFMYYYNWFLKDFLQKKIILSEEEADELFNEETQSVHSTDFIGPLKNDDTIFQDDSAIVHMSGNISDLGRILTVNRGLTKLFGYRKEELKNLNVSEIMPLLIAKYHNFFLETYIKTGKSKILYTQKKTFAKESSGYIVPIWLIVKQLNCHDGQVQYVGLLKPMTEKKDEMRYYILMNSFGEVSGVTRNTAEFFDLPEGLTFSDLAFNIILLAPKLIKYVYFGRLLMDDNHDRKEFDLGHAHAPKLDYTETKTMAFGTKGTMNPSTFLHAATMQKEISNNINTLNAFLELDNLRNDNIDENELDDSALEDFKEINLGNYQERNVEFTMRIPENLKSYIEEFEKLKARQAELKNNQKILYDGLHARFGKDKDKDEKPDSARGGKTSPRGALHNLLKYKHAYDAYIQALKQIATKIVKNKTNKIYRVKAVISTDYYGPHNEEIKFLKIKDVVTKKGDNLFSSLDSDKLTKENSTDMDASEMTKSKTSKAKTSAFKPPKNDGQEDPDKEDEDQDKSKNEDKYDDGDEEPDETAKMNPKSSDNLDEKEPETPGTALLKESQANNNEKATLLRKQTNKTDNETKRTEKKSEADASARNEILNQFKSSMGASYQSIYHKEENFLIDKNFLRLKSIKWFIRILFFTTIPINTIIFIVGASDSITQTSDAIDAIFINEIFRKNFLRAHDAISTNLLYNQHKYDNLSSVSSTQVTELLDFQKSNLNSSYQSLLTNNPTNPWATILYYYLPEVTGNIQVEHQGAFKEVSTLVSQATLKLSSAISDIIQLQTTEFLATNPEIDYYRKNSFIQFNDFLTEVNRRIFVVIDDALDKAGNLSVLILITVGAIFFASIFIILRLILVVIHSLREILETFTNISNEHVRETEGYYQRLMNIFKNSSTTKEKSDDQESVSTKKSSNQNSAKGISQARHVKKSKTIINGETFMKADSMRVLGYYFISLIFALGCTVAFQLSSKVMIQSIQTSIKDSKIFIGIEATHISSLVALKELFNNQTEYVESVRPYLNQTISSLQTTLDLNAFSSSLGWVDFLERFYNGTPCDSYRNLLTDRQYYACNTLGFQRLASGLVGFNVYYANYILDWLNLNPTPKYQIDMNNVYEFGELVDVIDSVFMQNILFRWVSDLEAELTSLNNIMIAILIAICMIDVLVFVLAERVVVGDLEEKFLFYRKIYNKYMLSEAVINEKRIVARLKKYKLLTK